MSHVLPAPEQRSVQVGTRPSAQVQRPAARPGALLSGEQLHRSSPSLSPTVSLSVPGGEQHHRLHFSLCSILFDCICSLPPVTDRGKTVTPRKNGVRNLQSWKNTKWQNSVKHIFHKGILAKPTNLRAF